MNERRAQKRPAVTGGDSDADRRKKQLLVKLENDAVVPRIHEFRVLLPNGVSLGLSLRDPASLMSLRQFLGKVREEYDRETELFKPRRGINWTSPDLHFTDASDNLLKDCVDFNLFPPNRRHILKIHDGSKAVSMYKNMWDLTPDTDLLMELPEEYTFETAIADLIDNSLQAVWSNDVKDGKIISIEVTNDKISIFDSGPGMDNTEENNIVKWGKMGASLHRSSRGKAIGGKPPYFVPVFGMFGYGGPVASMHLGRRTEVSSKTKNSKKVYLLQLERDALMSRSDSKQTWKTDGSLRDPSEDEISKFPHGSFTKVDIFGPKMRSLDISRLQCKLKDIYFPYIQCDELSNTGKTITPIEFQVNDTDLAEVDGGEVATTNLHSCNGPDFVLQLRFYFSQDSNPGARLSFEANARLKCVYFPVIQGKESIESILEQLEAQEYGITENYESYSRVSIRRLGRLLPDARWALLPFMDLRQRKGDKAQVLRKCCLRVKCFIDTDAGFNPTPSKTELAHQNPYTTALKNFGNKQTLEKERDIQVEIKRDGKPLTLSQVDKQYHDWIVQMHERYDEENDCGVDEPIIVVGSSDLKKLGISNNVFRVHKVLRRRGTTWKSGQKIKVLKGACARCHKQNLYATLEFFILDGFQGDAGGDAGGEARLICRLINNQIENGCQLSTNNGNPSLDLRESLSLPITVIDSGKCLLMDSVEWTTLLEKQNQKSPSSIEILNASHCQKFGIDVALPVEDVIDAGHVPRDKVVAIVRPTSFVSGSSPKTKILDDKYIVKENFEMALEVKFVPDRSLQGECHIYSGRESPSSRGSFHGLYVFQLKCKSLPLFQKAGVYTFSFSLRESGCKNLVKKIQVKGSSEVQRWEFLKKEQYSNICVRVGSCFPPFSIACYDKYDNRIEFGKVPELVVKVCSSKGTLANIAETNVSLSSNKSALRVKDLCVESSQLDTIQPSYEATLMVCERHGLLSVDTPIKVHPGPLERVVLQPTDFENQLLPGRVINELVLEMFDAYGNHLKKDDKIQLEVNGLCFEDKAAPVRKVDEQGCIDLSGLLKITESYGTTASLSVLSSGKKEVFRGEFQIEKRELRVQSQIPEKCAAGSQLENIIFEVVDSIGHVDESIHNEEKFGQSHTLSVRSESMDIDDTIRYSFRHGRCTVRTISIPKEKGKVSFVAFHSRHVELQLTIEVYVEAAPEMEKQNIEPLFLDGNSLSLPDSPVFKTSRVAYVDGSQHFSDYKTPLLPSPSSTKNVDIPICLTMDEQKELEHEIGKYGTLIGEYEKKLQYLQIQQSEIEKDLSELQASMDLVIYNSSGEIIGEEETMKRIESKTECAAAVVCHMLRISRAENDVAILDRVIGVVALLGTVQTIEFSRILAEYLRDKMLAVVCKSSKDLQFFERYEQDGSIKRDCGLNKLAPEVGVCINDRYDVLCLENLRPFTEVQFNDPQRKLVLPDPTLSNGAKPVGYLGYAVNMINLPIDYLCTKTSTGHGLRETLFYYLFGKLQVYETRKDMEVAKPCINEGAISLDGAIMRGDGAFSLGRWDPDILFPVVIPENLMDPSPKNLLVLKQIEEKKFQLRKTVAETEMVTKSHKKLKKKFSRRTESYNKFLDTL